MRTEKKISLSIVVLLFFLLLIPLKSEATAPNQASDVSAQIILNGYVYGLNRNPSSSEFNYWYNRTGGSNGNWDIAAVGILSSQECVNKYPYRIAWLDRVYLALLGRHVDSSGQKNWTRKKNNGDWVYSREEVVINILRSAEFNSPFN